MRHTEHAASKSNSRADSGRGRRVRYDLLGQAVCVHAVFHLMSSRCIGMPPKKIGSMRL